MLLILFFQAGRVPKTTLLSFWLIILVGVIFVIGITPPFVVLVIMYGLIGLAFGAISPLTSSLVADMYEGADKTTYISRLNGFFGLGGLLAPIFFKAMFDIGAHWTVSIRITLGIYAVTLIPYFLFMRTSIKSIDLPKDSDRRVSFGDIKGFVTSGSGTLLTLSSFFYGAHQHTLSVWIIRYVSVFLNSPAHGAFSLSLFWAGTTISRLFMHKLPSSPVKLIFIGNCASAAVMIAGILSRSPMLMTICVFAAGLLSGATVPVLVAAGCQESSSNTILPTNTLLLSMFVASSICLLLVGGLVAYTTMGSAILLSAISALLSGVFVQCYRRRKSCYKSKERDQACGR